MSLDAYRNVIDENTPRKSLIMFEHEFANKNDSNHLPYLTFVISSNQRDKDHKSHSAQTESWDKQSPMPHSVSSY